MKEKLIINYIAVWGWQTISLMFLIASFILASLPINGRSSVFFVSFFLIFIICQWKTLKRKRELYEQESKD